MRAHAIVSAGWKLAGGGAGDAARRAVVPEAAPADAAERAKRALQRLGFKVVGRGAASLTIEGPPALFKEVFSTSVRKERASPTKWAENVEFPLHRWRFDSPPVVPEDLRDLIDGVALPAAKSILP